ncbi:MAG: glycosyltransferase family 2 protein [Propionibacteriaceae bacterium]|nr:glycosyltransferase family 2 protein [Propionibacteriaceae bacterium]
MSYFSESAQAGLSLSAGTPTQQPRVTIILPAYNGARFLDRAIGSVLAQTVSRPTWVLMAINDGSTDDTLDILRDYQERYPDNIVVIDQENHGVARTRNDAIRRTQTEWLTFLDQDDYFDDTFLESMLNHHDLDECDVVVAGYVHRTLTGKGVEKIGPFPRGGAYARWMNTGVWGKLHRTTFVIDNDVDFSDTQFGEDTGFTFLENLAAGPRVGFVASGGYNWVINPQSVSQTMHVTLTPRSYEGFVGLVKRLVSMREDLGVSDPIVDFHLLCVAAYCLAHSRAPDKASFLAFADDLFAALTPLGQSATRNPYIASRPDGMPRVAHILTRIMISAQLSGKMRRIAPAVMFVQRFL